LRAPAGLIDIDRGGGPGAAQELLIGLIERVGRTPQDGVHRADAEAGAEQVAHEFHRVAAGDAVTHRERGDGRLQAGTERAPGNLAGKGGPHRAAALRAAQMVEAMLGHKDGDRGRFGDLVAGRPAIRATLGLAEAVAAPAARGPVVDDLIHRLGWDQMAPITFVTRLGAPFAAGRPGLLVRGRLRGILAGWEREVLGVAGKAPLQLGDALLLLFELRLQQGHLGRKGKERGNHCLASLVVDRLCFGALHARGFEAGELRPA